MSKGRHVPVRTCVACRAARPKAELIRIARGQEGAVVDEGARAAGRGAYVCRSAECVERLTKSAKARAAVGEALSREQAERLAALAAAGQAGQR